MRSTKHNVEELFKPWEKIQLVTGGEDAPGAYEARIEDFINGGLIISDPIFVGGSTRLREGADVEVQFTREDAAYCFTSKIKNLNSGRERQMFLSPPRRIRRMQRRRFVRIDAKTSVEYALIKPMTEWEDWEDVLEWNKTTCHNISGGGAAFATDNKIDQNTLVILRLEFFKNHKLTTEVAAICRRTFEMNNQIIAGVEFICAENLKKHLDVETLSRLPKTLKEFSHPVQEHLVTIIFAEQIEMRRRGAL